MNAGAFGENFPYSNFHDLNMDWIIKIAKDFLDQYTHLQETIANGETSLQNLTTSGLEQLQNKADALEALLQAWYDTHSEDIAQELATAIEDFTTEAEQVGARVIASIPSDYTALSESVNAFYMLNEEHIVTYNYTTKVLTIPGSTFCIYRGVPYTSTLHTLDLSNILQNGACNLWMKSDRSVIATVFTDRPQDVDALYLGSVYYRYVHINGISDDQIRIIDTDNLRHSMFPDNNGSFIGIEVEVRKVIVNTVEKNVALPGGFKVYRGRTFPYSAETISYTNDTANKFWMKNDGTIYTTDWNVDTPINSDDDCIGFRYGDTLKLAGIPDYAIFYMDATNKILPGTGLYFGDTYIGISEDQEASYNYNTHILSIPQGFYVYRGVGRTRPLTTIDVTDYLLNTACILYIQRNGTIYPKPWSSRELNSPTDQLIGYIYSRVVVLNGIDSKYISVIETSKTAYCFGDSIPAGTNTTKNYLQIMHEYNRDVIFKNYCVGSTGYMTEATGTVIAGDGSTDNGRSTTVSGNNTILQMINSVDSDTMPNILISAGTNDWSTSKPIADFRSSVQATLSRAKDFTQNIFVLTPIKRNGYATNTNSLGLTLKDYCDVIKEECAKEGAVYYEGYNIFLNPSLGTQRTAFVPDGLHPNAKGHARIARAIFDTVMQAFCQ